MVNQVPFYDVVGLKEKKMFDRHLIMLSSVCVQIQIHTEVILTEVHNGY